MIAAPFLAHCLLHLSLLAPHPADALPRISSAEEVELRVTAPDGRGPLFLAGSFNRWTPGDPAWQLQAQGEEAEGRWRLSVPLARLGEAPIECKLTRGSWDSVEVRADFSDRENRLLRASDLRGGLELKVEAWVDDRPGFVPAATRDSTVTGHLDIFEISSPQLKNTRKLRVWLPPGYSEATSAAQDYPVLYMHDGQNLFDAATSFQGVEWGLDESATRLIEAQEIPPMIIVGIDHAGAARTSEYNPSFTRHGGLAHRGDRYLDFVTRTVMPEIEKRYRIRRGPEHTGIGGSSYGGNITLYAGLRHPDRFGALLVESPIFWAFGDELMTRSTQREAWSSRVWLAVGQQESSDRQVQDGYLSGIEALRTTFEEQGLLPDRACLLVEEGAVHHESSWARRFPDALRFLFSR